MENKSKKRMNLSLIHSNLSGNTFLRKLCILILFFSNIFYGYADTLQDVRLTIHLSNTSITKVLNEIEAQSGYAILVRANDINLNQKVTVHVDDQSINDILNIVFKNDNVRYETTGKQVFVYKARQSEVNVLPQEKEIQGTIKGADGEPIIGASISVQGKTIGVISDLDGNFQLKGIKSGDILKISYIGYDSETIRYANQPFLAITLKEDQQVLEEVVVVGYGIQKKVNLTGSVGSVDMADVANRPIINAGNVLAGKISGVYALQSSAKPGSDDAVINIRGVGTLNNSDPLVLIDGFPGRMSDINPQDIDAISVLKDASSAAIYGNRAANGVILITTKKGMGGKVKVNYNGYFGMQKATALPDLMNAEEYCTLYNEFLQNAGMLPIYTQEMIDKYKANTDPLYPDIDYYDLYYRTANMQNHHFNIQGGSENLHFAAMGGYMKQDGILIKTDFEKYNFRANFDTYFLDNKRLRISGKISGDKSMQRYPMDEYYVKANASLSPILPLKNADGEWVSVNGEPNYYAAAMEGAMDKNARHHFNGQFEAEFRIIDGLSAEFTYAYDWTQLRRHAFHPNLSLYNVSGGYKQITSDLTVRNRTDRRAVMNTILRYNKTFAKKHTINALAGYSEEEYRYQWEDVYRKNFVNNTQPEINMGDASTQTNNGYHEELGLVSYFGRIGYIYDDRYLFEANIRHDGSSRFAKGNQWGTFPSFSAGWRISQEAFMKDVDWLTNLKLRASWGKLGNQNINSYYASSYILAVGKNYSLNGDLKPGVATTSLTNPDTTWETTTQTNIGLDLGINTDWTFTVDYFYKRTSDILMQIPIPITMGDLTAPYQNVGEVDNYGIELAANWNKRINKDLHINSTFNVSHIKNKVRDLNGRSPIISGVTVTSEGEAIHSLYGYKKDGVYQISDFTWQNNSDASIPHENRQYVLRDGVVTISNYNAQPGDLKFRDLDGDGNVSMEKDRTVIGKQFPDFTYSWQTDITWRDFDLSIFFQGVQGIDSYLGYYPFSNFDNSPTWYRNRWTPENPTNKYPRLIKDDARTGVASDHYMENASYLRLKNIELGYTIPEVITQKVGIARLRVYGNIQNAFTITNFKGFDPERPTDQTSIHAFPQTRIFTVGVNLNF